MSWVQLIANYDIKNEKEYNLFIYSQSLVTESAARSIFTELTFNQNQNVCV